MMGKHVGKRVLSVLLSLVLLLSVGMPAAFAANAEDAAKTTAATAAEPALKVSEEALPEGYQWQGSPSFPDWNGSVDDTLAMNSLYSFTSFSGQGKLYVKVAEGVTGFRMFVNNVEVDTSVMKAGGTYGVEYAEAALDGTNTIQVTNIAPSSAKGAVTVYIPYPTVISGKPEDVGMDADTLEIVNDLIRTEVKYGFSGAQLAVIKDGRLVVSEAYGLANGWNQDGTRIVEGDSNYVPVTRDTLYDLASNSKMYTVNYALQYMLSKGGYDISLDDPITKFFPQFDDEGYTVYKAGTEDEMKAQILEWKSQLTVRDILMHQAGFDPDPQYHNNTYDANATDDPEAPLNPLFSQTREKTLEMVLRSPLTYEPGTNTKYSDVDYMLMCFILEQVAGMGLDEFLKEVFWDPMGLTHVTFNPLKNGFTKEQTAATELWGNTRGEAMHGPVVEFENVRTETCWGGVHDEKAYYAMEGISGHAGLYANAEELARLCNLMLTGGEGGLKFFDMNVLDEFTKPKTAGANSTFGLGWWVQSEVGRINYFTTHASDATVGHQGWTGTLTAIDPERNLVVVLLTNKKNSPVLDNTVNQNDFYSDNMVLGGLGAAVGYVYESLDSSPAAIDASLAQLAKERTKILEAHKDAYDENVHMADAFAMVDLVITRAEHRKTQSTADYAKTALADLKTYVAEYVGDTGTMPDTVTKNKDQAALWLEELEARVAQLKGQAAEDTGKVITPAAVKDALPLIDAEGQFQGGDQNAVFFPRAYNGGSTRSSTSYCYQNSITWFEGYKGQGTVYVAVRQNIPALQIYINGVQVDTSSMLHLDEVKVFAIDVSGIAVNGRNTIQVTGMPIETVRTSGAEAPILVAVPNQTVVEGKPEEVGLNPAVLDTIDTIIRSDVSHGFPSAQLAVVKDGKMVYSNAWGIVNSYHPDGTPIVPGDPEYAAVTTDTLYDLASNTKMYATNYAIQKLVSEGKIQLSDKITTYFPEFDDEGVTIYRAGTTEAQKAEILQWKSELTLQDILQHQAGFEPDPQYHNEAYDANATDDPNAPVNPLFSQDKDTTLKKILASPLLYQPGTETKYSDVDFMLLGFIIEQVTGQALDEYVQENFYKPLGLTHITFNPLENGFTQAQVAATELNGNSRDGVIHFQNIRTGTCWGTVHDEKAYYAMDGISGHAGLYSNAEDLAKLAQSMLNYSGYGTTKMWSAKVPEYFTGRKATLATWGQGWYREAVNGRPWYFGVQSARNTIGHQGWTGTLTVIDPSTDLVIVFLTNKINSPVTDNQVNPNKFNGNWYTTSTLGFVANILNLGLQENDASRGNIQPALDALVADMAVDKMRLVEAAGVTQADHPIVKAAQAIQDLTPGAVAAISGADAHLYTEDHIAFADLLEDGTFQPDKTVSRAEAASMFARLLKDADPDTSAVSFSDVDAAAPAGEAILKLAALGYLKGDEDGAFHPDAAMTRGEFVELAARFAKAIPVSPSFPDAKDHPCAAAIGTAQYYGWVSGDGTGSFHPDREITRAEAVTVVNRMLGRYADESYLSAHAVSLCLPDVPLNHWAYTNIVEAVTSHAHTVTGCGEIWTSHKEAR